MGENISRTIEFLKEQFDNSDYMAKNQKPKKYRLEDTKLIINFSSYTYIS